MKKSILGLVGALLLSEVFIHTPVVAEDVQLRADYPDSYTVVPGDTLWDISSRFLSNPWKWPEIWHVNPQIQNPHLIYPGDVIRMIYLDGQPRLTLDSSNRVVKLSPQVRVTDNTGAIPAIPLDQINNFLSRSRVLTAEELDKAPHVVAGDAKRLVVGKGDIFYARGTFDNSLDTYGIYRRGSDYIDPVTGELLGIEAMDIGSGKMRALEGDIATLMMTRSTEEARAGDRLITEEQRTLESTFFPSEPSFDVNGLIIAVEGGVSQVGRYDVVAINRGEREGMKVGNVLAVYKTGAQVKDRVKGDVVTLPDERAGLVMVFRTFEKLSLGLVLEAERPLAIHDKLKNP